MPLMQRQFLLIPREAYKECDAILAKDLPVSVILHSMNTYLFNDTNYEGLVYSCGNYVFTYLKAL